MWQFQHFNHLSHILLLFSTRFRVLSVYSSVFVVGFGIDNAFLDSYRVENQWSFGWSLQNVQFVSSFFVVLSPGSSFRWLHLSFPLDLHGSNKSHFCCLGSKVSVWSFIFCGSASGDCCFATMSRAPSRVWPKREASSGSASTFVVLDLIMGTWCGWEVNVNGRGNFGIDSRSRYHWLFGYDACTDIGCCTQRGYKRSNSV